MANFTSKPDKQPYSTCLGVCDKLNTRPHMIDGGGERVKKVGVVVEKEEDSGRLFLNAMTQSFQSYELAHVVIVSEEILYAFLHLTHTVGKTSPYMVSTSKFSLCDKLK